MCGGRLHKRRLRIQQQTEMLNLRVRRIRQRKTPVTLPFLNTGKIYYNICPSNRIAYETQKAYIKEEGKREREKERESGIEEIHIQ